MRRIGRSVRTIARASGERRQQQQFWLLMAGHECRCWPRMDRRLARHRWLTATGRQRPVPRGCRLLHCPSDHATPLPSCVVFTSTPTHITYCRKICMMQTLLLPSIPPCDFRCCRGKERRGRDKRWSSDTVGVRTITVPTFCGFYVAFQVLRMLL